MKLPLKIILFALILRLIPFAFGALFNPNGLLLFDSSGYLNIADNLIEHQVFSRASSTESLMPDISRTPIFPLFLSVIKIFGGSNSIIVFIIMVIGSLNALLAYKLCSLLFNNIKLACIAAFIVAIDIPSIYFSNVIMTETLFTSLLLLSSISFIAFLKSNNQMQLIYSGILLSLLILCRPVAVYLPLFFIIVLIYYRVAFKHISIFILCSYLLVFAWVGRNKATFNTYVLSSISSINLYFYTNASIIAETNGVSLDEAQYILKDELQSSFQWQNSREDISPMIKYCQTETVKSIVSHPVIFLKQTTIGFIYFFIKPLRNYIDTFLGVNQKFYEAISGKTMFNETISKLLKKTSPTTLFLVVVQLIAALIMLFFSIISIVRFGNDNKMQLGFILVIILYFAVLSSITQVDGRFRVPIIPFWAVLTAFGFSKTKLIKYL